MQQTLHLIFGSSGQPITWWQMTLRAVIFVYDVAVLGLTYRRLFGQGSVLERSGNISVIGRRGPCWPPRSPATDPPPGN